MRKCHNCSDYSYRCRAAQAYRLQMLPGYENPAMRTGKVLCAGKFKTNNGTAPCQLCPSKSAQSRVRTSTDCIICPAENTQMKTRLNATMSSWPVLTCRGFHAQPVQTTPSPTITTAPTVRSARSTPWPMTTTQTVCAIHGLERHFRIACVAGTIRRSMVQTVRHARKEPSVDRAAAAEDSCTTVAEPTPTRLACRHVITVSSMRHPLQQVRISAIVTVNPAMKAGRTIRALPVRRQV